MDRGSVTHENAHGVGIITFYHPAANSLPGELLQKLAKTINDVGVDNRIKVLIVKSEGNDTFCSGASFDELRSISTETEGKKFFMGFANVINAMRKCHKFIIVPAHAKAVGGGVGIIAAADYAFGTQDSKIKLAELGLGIGPFIIGPAIQRKMGLSAFSQLTIDTREWRSADWAKRNGLFGEIYPNEAVMYEAANKLAAQLAHSNPEAMSQLKKTFWLGTENWDTLLEERAALSGRLVLSDFTRNALKKVTA